MYTLMRTYLVFKKNGEVSERICNCKKFDMSKLSSFDHYKKYEKYIVLYNENESDEINLTELFFTTDKFKGTIAVVKLDKSGNMVDLNCTKYFKCIIKKGEIKNDLYYSSDEERLDYNFT